DSTALEFQVISSKYSPLVFENTEADSLKQLMQSTIALEMNSYLKGQIIYENMAELKGLPCYWFLIRYNDHRSLKACLIWDQTNLISLMHYSDFDLRLSSD